MLLQKILLLNKGQVHDVFNYDSDYDNYDACDTYLLFSNRDSKLTKLLADSLAGNGVTLMVCEINHDGYGNVGDDVDVEVEDNDDNDDDESALPSNRVDLLFCRVVTSR